MQAFEKAFLRACINHSSMPLDKADKILEALCVAYGGDQTDIKELVEKINELLGEYNQKLTFYKHPLYDGPEFLVFGLTFESEICKKSMEYTEADRYYFTKLMETTVKQEDYGIFWADTYDVVEPSVGVDKKLPKQKMQELVQKWTNQGYYLQKDEKLYLGPRMLVEYGNHLQRTYADWMHDCPLCNQLVLWDIKCSECDTKLHRDCIRKYLAQKSNCPSCKKKWNTRLQ